MSSKCFQGHVLSAFWRPTNLMICLIPTKITEGGSTTNSKIVGIFTCSSAMNKRRMAWKWIGHNSLRLIAASENPLPCFFISNGQNLGSVNKIGHLYSGNIGALGSSWWQNRRYFYKGLDFFLWVWLMPYLSLTKEGASLFSANAGEPARQNRSLLVFMPPYYKPHPLK